MQTRKKNIIWAFTLCFCAGLNTVHANPLNPDVVAGSARFSASGSLLEINNTPGTIINWQDFSIAADEITRFVQQSSNSAVLNRVTGVGISQILGSLQSNGQVFVINPNGLVMGENAVIDTAGFIGSTLNIDNQSFSSGQLEFTGTGGTVENRGLIQVRGSGDVVLLGTKVINSGLVQTEGGNIVLAAGREIGLSFAEMDHITFNIQAPTDSVVNIGQIIARGGNAALYGGQVEQQGSIELVQSPDGRIFIDAKDSAIVSGTLAAPGGQITVLGEHIWLQNADLSTSSGTDGGDITIGGDYQGSGDLRHATTTSIDSQSQLSASSLTAGDGGRIIVWSDQQSDVYGQLVARGGSQSGDGGFIETSSAGQLNVNASVSVSAANGDAGEWLLDPEDIDIDEGLALSIENTLNEGGDVTVKTADQGDGEGNITVSAAITKTSGEDSNLTLDAHNRIDINAPIKSESNQLNVNLTAGRSVNVNAAITTNGGNLATVITGVLVADDVEVEVDASQASVVDNGPGDTTEQTEANGPAEQIVQQAETENEAQTELVDTNEEETDASLVDQSSEELATENPLDSPEQDENTESADSSTINTDVEVAVSESPGEAAPAEQTENVEQAAEQVQVSIVAAVNTSGGSIEINAGSDAEVIVSAALDASNSADNSVGGDITIETGAFVTTAEINASGGSQGGTISINAEQSVTLAGDLIADGETGGAIDINTDQLLLAETISAQGSGGAGGSVDIDVASTTQETNTSTINVSGAQGGRIAHIAGGQITTSGHYLALGNSGNGGEIDLSASTVKLQSALLDASGEQGGGKVRIGGEFQGGKNLQHDELANAQLLAVDKGSQISADGLGEGSDGGYIVLWADEQTAVYGNISAAQNRAGAPVGEGGFVEISSGDTLTFNGHVTAGFGGTVLFDPKDIIIDNIPTALVSDAVFANIPATGVTISADSITEITETGSDVVLQANSDISVLENIITDNPGGDGGDITLQAGSRIIINADIFTDNGNFTAIANELIANGSVDSERNDLFADLIISGAHINAGTGNVLLAVRDDPAKVDNLRGSIFLVAGAQITANDLTINEGNNVLVGLANATSPATIDLSGNLDVDIDGRFDVFGGTNINAGAHIVVDGAATVSASLIRFVGDVGSGSLQADSIDLNSQSLVVLDNADLFSNQLLQIGASGDIQISGDDIGGGSRIESLSAAGISLNSGGSIIISSAADLIASAGAIDLSASQDFEFGGVGDGNNFIHAALDVEIVAGGKIDIFGTIAPSSISGLSSIAGGNITFDAGSDITVLGGGAVDAGVIIDGSNVNFFSDQGSVSLIGGGSATAAVQVIATENIDVNADQGFVLFSGSDLGATTSLVADGDVNIVAGFIEARVDSAATTIVAENVGFNSASTVFINGAQISATQNIVLDSLGDVDIGGDDVVGIGMLQTAFGMLDLNVGGSVNLDGEGQLFSGSDLTIDAVDDLNLSSVTAGVHSITAGANLDVNVGGAININGGNGVFGGSGSAIIEVVGDANFNAGSSIIITGGDLANSGVGIFADNISFSSGADILFQGGDADSASVLVDGNGTVNINAIGSLTLTGGTAAGSDALIFSNSLTTINIEADSVGLFSDIGGALLNVLDGAVGSTVNIITTIPGDCIHCVQVGVQDSQGIVADIINLNLPPVIPPAPPAQPPAVPQTPPEVVVVEPPQAPVPEVVIVEEPFDNTLIGDIINEVVALSSSEESANEESEEEDKEKETQCRA